MVEPVFWKVTVIFFTSPGARVSAPPPVVDTRVVDKLAALALNGVNDNKIAARTAKEVSFFKKFGIMPFQYITYVRRPGTRKKFSFTDWRQTSRHDFWAGDLLFDAAFL